MHGRQYTASTSERKAWRNGVLEGELMMMIVEGVCQHILDEDSAAIAADGGGSELSTAIFLQLRRELR